MQQHLQQQRQQQQAQLQAQHLLRNNQTQQTLGDEKSTNVVFAQQQRDAFFQQQKMAAALMAQQQSVEQQNHLQQQLMQAQLQSQQQQHHQQMQQQTHFPSSQHLEKNPVEIKTDTRPHTEASVLFLFVILKCFKAPKYPVLWEGLLAMKNTDCLVQMHRVCGNEKLMDITNKELVSQNAGKKMDIQENYVALVGLPCGHTREDISAQSHRMTTNFIDYFTSKMAAGIVNQGPQTPSPSCVAHVFPPSDFATEILTTHAPDLLETIEKHNAGYLFVVITSNN